MQIHSVPDTISSSSPRPGALQHLAATLHRRLSRDDVINIDAGVYITGVTLTTAASLIGAGRAVRSFEPCPVTDIDGQARPFGVGFDIGYDEQTIYPIYLPLVLR